MLKAKVDQYSSDMVLDVARVLGAVVGVIPLVRGQQQLTQHVRHAAVQHGLVVLRI